MVGTIGFSVLELVKANSNILGSDGLSASVIGPKQKPSKASVMLLNRLPL